jgi:hypothetical protein
MFVGKSLFTQSCGESVASGLTETEKDSNLDTRRAILEPSHHGPYDAHHVAGEPRSQHSRGDSIPSTRRVGAGQGQRDRCAADRSGDGLGCAAGEVGNSPQRDSVLLRYPITPCIASS